MPVDTDRHFFYIGDFPQGSILFLSPLLDFQKVSEGLKNVKIYKQNISGEGE
jgi:hypothetical protein